MRTLLVCALIALGCVTRPNESLVSASADLAPATELAPDLAPCEDDLAPEPRHRHHDRDARDGGGRQ